MSGSRRRGRSGSSQGGGASERQGRPSGRDGSGRDGSRGNGRGRGGRGQPHSRGGRSGQNPDRNRHSSSERADAPILSELTDLTPFSVFCAFHLFITERDGYREQRPSEVAARFQMSEDELLDYLDENDLSEEILKERQFDLPGARLDIRVAPMGISRVELARTMYQEFEESA